ncbi:MAG: TerB family tellurite resistance protein [Flavobacterium sp.]|nr:TerB family tellurite resistance protein [Flavobacterium sp.]
MSISDLYDSGFRNRNKGHFSAIVRVALSDGTLSQEEKKFLDKLAIKLEISPAEYEEILANPLKYPVNPPLLHTHRLERLYDLARMVYTDEHVMAEKEQTLLTRFALALGFTPGNVNYIVDKALKLVAHKVDLDTFTYEMQHMYK